ncbi:hypothetical protein trd_1686 [Thermomicrobium roseum DSM 5159]|uniref:Uncharacterized protein n=1 Tax=Thermomicrobium roseum (strain ATCC 27502 / DSM 5159 / P-2) TaxID=309801 RepID=B9L0X6_THERP|nr:hypothetical protein trd_1686 [Thermomicrobium roseum DSM 5159]
MPPEVESIHDTLCPPTGEAARLSVTPSRGASPVSGTLG